MYYSVFASVQDVVKQAHNPPNWEQLKQQYPKDRYEVERMENEWNSFVYGGSFHGGGLAAVTKKFEGDHSYEATITANIESQFESENFYKKKFRFHNRQIQGQRVDIPRYLNGDPRYWFSVKKIPMPNRAVRVFAPMGGLYGISSRQMQVCGALSCAICEALEANGIAVELWASCCCSRIFGFRDGLSDEERSRIAVDRDWRDICHLVKLKDSSQYCDLGMINYVTGDSGFYRQIIFLDRIYAGAKRYASGVKYTSCGGSYNFSKDLIPPDEDHNVETDIVVPRIYDIEEAKRWLEQNLNAAVCNVNNHAQGGGSGEPDPEE